MNKTLTHSEAALVRQNSSSLSAFRILWFGQLISILGSATADFAVGIWVYQQTGSVFRFAMIALTSVLPRLLISPLAGVVVDRWNRRTVMLVSDFVHALCSLTIWLLLLSGQLEIGLLYIVMAVAALASAFQEPAYQAAIPQLVHKEQLGQANGMVDLARGAGQLLAPLLGGFLLAWIGLGGIIMLDLSTFLVAVVTLTLVRVPDLVASPTHDDPAYQVSPTKEADSGWRQEFAQGWHFLLSQPALLMLMFYIAATVFLLSLLEVLVTPLVLSFSNERALGMILTSGGVGLLVGGALMSWWGGPKQRIYGMLLFDLLAALIMIGAGLRASEVWLAVVAFSFFVTVPISRGSLQAIWQSSVPQTLQGRVFTLRDMLAISASPLAFLLAGPLADQVFEPWMANNGWLAGTVGSWIGVGKGRGIALLFIVMGLLFLTMNVLAWGSRKIRNIEQVQISGE
ncbi:MAG: MFS transporter [Caldilineaceae bacterium]